MTFKVPRHFLLQLRRKGRESLGIYYLNYVVAPVTCIYDSLSIYVAYIRNKLFINPRSNSLILKTLVTLLVTQPQTNGVNMLCMPLLYSKLTTVNGEYV
jgi:hypothetical protein